MARVKKTKNNPTYFEVIPKVSKKNELALEYSMELGKLVAIRTGKVVEQRQLHKEIYNLSVDIHEIESKLAEMFGE